jgi:hypothetical protein
LKWHLLIVINLLRNLRNFINQYQFIVQIFLLSKINLTEQLFPFNKITSFGNNMHLSASSVLYFNFIYSGNRSEKFLRKIRQTITFSIDLIKISSVLSKIMFIKNIDNISTYILILPFGIFSLNTNCFFAYILPSVYPSKKLK